MRKLAIADEDEDEEEEAVAGLVIGPSLPPAYDPAATADATDAAAEAVEDPGNAESALGAALAQWSLNKPAGKVASPAPEPASLDAAPASPRRAVESFADKASTSSPFRLEEYTDVHTESPSRSSLPAPAAQPEGMGGTVAAVQSEAPKVGVHAAPPKLPAFALSNDLIFDLA